MDGKQIAQFDLDEFSDDDEEIVEFLQYERRPYVMRERHNYFEIFDDEDFFRRFRLKKQTVLNILEEIEENIETPTERNKSVSPINQLLLALRFYATGNFLISVGDFINVSKSAACNIVKKVSNALASLSPKYIRMPQTAEEIAEHQHQFFIKARLPRVIGSIDCTHIKIQSPGGLQPEIFRNRKGYFSLNVQTISSADLEILDIVARWPESTHDQIIFENSNIHHRLHANEFGNSLIVADSGYEDTPHVVTPLNEAHNQIEQIYNESVGPKVKCYPDKMRVEVPIVPSNTKQVYLEGLKNYPDPACRPHTDATGTLAVLELDLGDVYRCAVTRVVNEKTGKQIFYQTLVVEGEEKTEDGQSKKTRETIHVKCSILSLRNHTVSRRSVLPAGFQEPEDLEITKTVTEVAPEPILGVGVRQAGKLVTGELNVSPGTPLQMEIFLDKVSAAIYGILVTHMQVTDTKSQEETIIYNGCSVDPYLFENFQTEDGDFLTAKFRAFKFPESTYVQFKGTVNVCLNKCQGVECSDGQIGYGRRRRSLPTLPADPNKIFEITITSFIKVNYDDESENFEAIIKNQTKIFEKGSVSKLQTRNMQDRRFYETVQNQEQTENRPLLIQKEKEQYITVTDQLTDSAIGTLGNALMVLVCSLVILLRV